MAAEVGNDDADGGLVCDGTILEHFPVNSDVAELFSYGYAMALWRALAMPKAKTAKKAKVKRVMDEFQSGDLHSGSKSGPVVTNRKQAIAIALSESGQSKPKSKRTSS